MSSVSETTPPAPRETAAIHSWHAHVYYDPATTRADAALLRDWIGARFDAVLGRWHDVPVGPHPQAMYQVAFGLDVFAGLVPFLSLNRMGLTILVHPETGEEYIDHMHRALWFGAVLKLDGSGLKGYPGPG